MHGLHGSRWFLMFQMLLAILFFCIFLGVSWNSALSALAAGVICSAPNALFAHQFFQRNGAQQAQRIVSRFYKGEAVKIFVSAVLFAVVFAWHGLVPEVFFGVYLVLLLSHVFAPWFFGLSSNRTKVFFVKRNSDLHDIQF